MYSRENTILSAHLLQDRNGELLEVRNMTTSLKSSLKKYKTKSQSANQKTNMCIYKLIILNNNINLQIKKRKMFAAQKDAIEMI